MEDRENNLKLFQENLKLAPFLLCRYYPKFSKDEDLLQEAYIGLWKSCLTYDDSKGAKFSTYASRVICNQIGMELRKRNRVPSRLSLDVPISELSNEGDGCSTFGEIIEDEKLLMENQGIDLRDFISHLDERESSIIKNLLSGLNQKETSWILGISQPYCSKILKGVRKKYGIYSNEEREEN